MIPRRSTNYGRQFVLNHKTKEMTRGTLGGIGRVLGSRNFVLYCTGLGLSLMGSYQPT